MLRQQIYCFQSADYNFYLMVESNESHINQINFPGPKTLNLMAVDNNCSGRKILAFTDVWK